MHRYKLLFVQNVCNNIDVLFNFNLSRNWILEIMIIGSGMLANAFKSYFSYCDIVIFASGVSNSSEFRDSEFKMSVNYYMYSSENGFKRLQTKRRSFIKTIPQHKKEIRKLFRQNKIVLSKEKSMIQAFELLDNENLLN